MKQDRQFHRPSVIVDEWQFETIDLLGKKCRFVFPPAAVKQSREMSELHFSLRVATILSTLLAYTDTDTVVKTANGEGEPSDKVCEIVAAPATERLALRQKNNTQTLLD